MYYSSTTPENFIFAQTAYQTFNFMFSKFESCVMPHFEVMSIFIHTIFSFFIQMFQTFHREGSHEVDIDRSTLKLQISVTVRALTFPSKHSS